MESRVESDIQKLCQTYENRIKASCEELAKQLAEFHKEKAAILGSTAVSHDVDRMLPPSFSQLFLMAYIGTVPVQETTRLPVVETTACQEVTTKDSQTAGKPLHDTKTTANIPTHDTPPNLTKPKPTLESFFTANTSSLYKKPGPVAKENVMAIAKEHEKPKTINNSKTIASKTTTTKPHLSPKKPPIASWHVEGLEFLFEYAKFGPGWFVIRCERSDGFPTTFQQHPLEQGRAMQHFGAKCKYHERVSTEEAMVVKYAQRVVDEDGVDVDDEWAEDANERLEDNIERVSRSRARRKSREVAFSQVPPSTTDSTDSSFMDDDGDEEMSSSTEAGGGEDNDGDEDEDEEDEGI